MDTYERSLYLSERSYQDAKSVDEECFGFWKEILGEEKLSFLRQLYPCQVEGYLCDEEFSGEKDLPAILEAIPPLLAGRGQITIPDTVIFEVFYRPFVEREYAVLKKRIGTDLTEGVRNSLALALVKRLEKICLQVLIQELHSCRDNQLLTGDSPEEKYNCYNQKSLNSDSWRTELFSAYPVMLRCMNETAAMFTELVGHVWNRFWADRKEIEEYFFAGEALGEILDIELNISDSHNQGKMVCILLFSKAQRLVYKPRSMQNESSYQEILGYISQGCGVDQYAYKILDQGSYSWMEYINNRSCDHAEDLVFYYERLGVHLFVNQLMGGEDLHYENLIAMGAYPIMLDMEVLLGGRGGLERKDAADSVRFKLQDSVLFRGILPFSLWDQDGSGVNVSIMDGSGGQEVPFKVPMVIHPYTCDMQIEYRSPVLESSKNLPHLQGKFMGARQFTADLTRGFQGAYRFFLEHKERVIERIRGLVKLKRRVLFRNTQQYNMYQTLSYNPSFLQDGAGREMILYDMFSGEEDERRLRIVESEVRDLLHGDVPYFYQFSGETVIYNSQGEQLGSYDSRSSIELITDRAMRMDQKDCDQQSRFIQLSMNLLFNEERKDEVSDRPLLHPENGLEPQDCEDVIIRCATAIADQILAGAIYTDDHTDVNWIGMNLMESAKTRWKIEPMTHRLYDGIGGIALLVFACHRYAPRETYREACEVLKRSLFGYTQTVLANPQPESSSGLYVGESSIAYCYQLLYQMTGDSEFLQYAERHCQAVLRLIDYDSTYDLLSGNAGAIMVFLNMFELTEKKSYIEWAAKAAESLLSNYVQSGACIAWAPVVGETPLLGFSHGTSGIVYALTRLYAHHQDERYRDVIRGALQYEDLYFSEKHGNWQDLREVSQAGGDPYMVAWCHGAAGILISRAAAAKIFDGGEKNKLANEIAHAKRAVANSFELEHYCLCHGNIGNVSILERYTDSMQRQQCRNYYADFARRYLAGEIHFSMQEDNNYGFMSGISGIGYNLLKSIYLELPDVLMGSV